MRLTVLAVLGSLACGFAGPILAEPESTAPAPVEETRFARVDLDDAGEPRALQMAIVTYAPAGDADHPVVDLIGAVHVGEAGYYAELNARFRAYDVLLYEMVAPAGASVPRPGAERSGFIPNAQLAMRSALGLEYQLDRIDYTARNFVHADLSPDELRERMRERNESLYVYFWRAFYASIRESARDPLGLGELGLLASLFTPGDVLPLKTAMAYELARVDRVNMVIDGPDGSALIAERNQRAIDVLKAELASGADEVGIFYGVAHMPDLERRLADQLDLAPARVRWVDAWRLGDQPPEALR
jgi:hypothetical protein